MKKISEIFVLALAALMLFASCEQPGDMPEKEPVEVGDRSIVDVNLDLHLEQEKSLKSDLNRDIKFWEFMATPKFTLAEGEKIYGEVPYWRVLKELDTVDGTVKTSANLGRYTSGDWYFEIRALNSNRHVVAVGSKQQVIREGLDNTINIIAYTDRADGTHGESADATSKWTQWEGTGDYKTEYKNTLVEKGSMHVGLVINRLDADLNNLKIVTTYQKLNKPGVGGAAVQTPVLTWDDRNTGEMYTNWYISSTPENYAGLDGDSAQAVEDGKVYYETKMDGMAAGPYIFIFKLQGKDKAGDWIDLGGQAVDVMVVGGEETQVKGTLLANEYVLAGLKITSPGTIYGSINGKHYIQGNVGTPVKLEWKQNPTEQEDSGEEAKHYIWYVNGVEQKTDENSFTFECPKNSEKVDDWAYGIYRISCIPTGELGSTGNATIDVIFNPAGGPNDGEFDWSGLN